MPFRKMQAHLWPAVVDLFLSYLEPLLVQFKICIFIKMSFLSSFAGAAKSVASTVGKGVKSAGGVAMNFAKRLINGDHSPVILNGKKYRCPGKLVQYTNYYYRDGNFYGKYLGDRFDASSRAITQYFSKDINNYEVDDSTKMVSFTINEGILKQESDLSKVRDENFNELILDDDMGTLAAVVAARSPRSPYSGGNRRTRNRNRSRKNRNRRQQSRRNRRQ